MIDKYSLRIKYLCDKSIDKVSPVECKDTEKSTNLLRQRCHGSYECNVSISVNFVSINADCLPVHKDIVVDYICGRYY